MRDHRGSSLLYGTRHYVARAGPTPAITYGLETYSLMIGSLALFVVVSALMMVTQVVNWSAAGHASEA
jgi:hypothetical protein